MAQTARVTPMPDTPTKGRDESEWMHELTPTLSDEAMFDEEGHVRPLQVWPTESTSTEPTAKLRLVRKDESPDTDPTA